MVDELWNFFFFSFSLEVRGQNYINAKCCFKVNELITESGHSEPIVPSLGCATDLLSALNTHKGENNCIFL